MTDKKAEKAEGEIKRGVIEIDGEPLATETFTVNGQTITVRELLTTESDEAWDAAMGPDGKLNTRLNSRMQIAKAMVEPKTTTEGVGKFGSRKYLTVLNSFNRLNSLPEENPTVPAGSAGPTSPDTGESSPTT